MIFPQHIRVRNGNTISAFLIISTLSSTGGTCSDFDNVTPSASSKHRASQSPPHLQPFVILFRFTGPQRFSTRVYIFYTSLQLIVLHTHLINIFFGLYNQALLRPARHTLYCCEAVCIQRGPRAGAKWMKIFVSPPETTYLARYLLSYQRREYFVIFVCLAPVCLIDLEQCRNLSVMAKEYDARSSWSNYLR